MRDPWTELMNEVSGAGWTSRTARTNDARIHVSIAVPVYRIGVESGSDQEPKTTGERPLSRLSSAWVYNFITGAAAGFATSSRRPGRHQCSWGAFPFGTATERQDRAWRALETPLRARDSDFPGRHGGRPVAHHRALLAA